MTIAIIVNCLIILQRYVARDWWDPLLDKGPTLYSYDAQKDAWGPYKNKDPKPVLSVSPSTATDTVLGKTFINYLSEIPFLYIRSSTCLYAISIHALLFIFQKRRFLEVPAQNSRVNLRKGRSLLKESRLRRKNHRHPQKRDAYHV